jgi:hypothetical protein
VETDGEWPHEQPVVSATMTHAGIPSKAERTFRTGLNAKLPLIGSLKLWKNRGKLNFPREN